MKRILARMVPHPGLSVTLTLLWLLLNNSIAAGTVLAGAALGLVIPLLTAPYWPGSPRMSHPHRLLAYLAIVLVDIVASNVAVAWLVLFRRSSTLRPMWITVPIDLRTPEAITLLAGTVTLTPGTISADLAADGHSLLVHSLHAPDPDAVRRQIKHRYERRLKEIFE